MDNNAVNNVAVDLQNGTAAAPATEPQTLADVIGVSEQPAEQQPSPQSNLPVEFEQKDPGWFQKRLPKYYEKWDQEHQAKMSQLQDQVDTLREYFVTNEIEKLVSSGKITDREMAETYVRATMKTPAPQTPPANTPQRDAQGRFVTTPKAPEVPVEVQQRASTLIAQADAILGTTGVDVMQVFNTDPAVKQKVVSGEWDFTDVFKNAGGGQQVTVKPHVPAPVRSSNGVGLGNVSIGKMSNQQFAALNDFLAKNGKVNMS